MTTTPQLPRSVALRTSANRLEFMVRQLRKTQEVLATCAPEASGISDVAIAHLDQVAQRCRQAASKPEQRGHLRGLERLSG